MAGTQFNFPRAVKINVAGRPYGGAQAFFYQNGTQVPQTIYRDKALTTEQQNPVPADDDGYFPPIWLDPNAPVDYQVRILSGNGVELDNLPDVQRKLFTITSDDISSALDTLKRTDAEIAVGVTPVNGAYFPGHVLRYHATGTLNMSAADDTTALLNMFKVCIKGAQLGGANSCKGYICAGTYKVNEGVLVFNCNQVDLPWPDIETAGYRAVNFVGQAAADQPMLTLTNGTATGTAGHYWSEGSLGGISFSTTRTTGVNGHGIALTGCWGIHFGYMYGTGLMGSTISMPLATFAGDPDPNAVDFCVFEGVEGINCLFTIDNENGIGLDSCHFKVIRGVFNTQGVFKNGGDGILVDHLSAGLCMGYAYDEPGAPNRNRVLDMECDGCQYGLRINAGFENSYTGLRFVHRFQLAPNGTANYWPRKCLDITGSPSPSLKSTHIQAIHRVEAGGAKKDLGIFCDLHASAATFSDVKIEQALSNQSGFTFTDADFYRNLPLTQNILLTFDGKRIQDTRVSSIVQARGDGTTSILNTGFNTTANIVAFPGVVLDPNATMSASKFIAPYSGVARFIANVPLTMAADIKVRMAIMEVIVNSIATTGTLIAGSGYTNGVYPGVILVGGTGQRAIATITVAGGVVTVVTITTAGSNYTVGDVLYAVNSDIGGTGVGFSVNVATVTALTYSGALLYRVLYSATTLVQSYTIEGLASVVAGCGYCLSMDQGTAGNIAPSTPSGAYQADVYFHVEMCNYP